MSTLVHIFLSFFGAVVGSFLGLVIDRLPRKESIIIGRSHCEICNHNLSPIELIPIVSFLVLKGKCKACHHSINKRTILLEFICLTGFNLLFIKYRLRIEFIISFILLCILLIIFFIDMDTLIINDRFIILIAVLGLVQYSYSKTSVIDGVMGALILSLPLAIVSIRTGSIGFGDVKLLFASGLLLAYQRILVAFIIATLMASIFSIFLLTKKSISLKSALPFGPFLCFGIFTGYLYGGEIMNWYLNLLF